MDLTAVTPADPRTIFRDACCAHPFGRDRPAPAANTSSLIRRRRACAACGPLIWPCLGYIGGQTCMKKSPGIF
jgi:hypothetical protein